MKRRHKTFVHTVTQNMDKHDHTAGELNMNWRGATRIPVTKSSTYIYMEIYRNTQIHQYCILQVLCEHCCNISYTKTTHVKYRIKLI